MSGGAVGLKSGNVMSSNRQQSLARGSGPIGQQIARRTVGTDPVTLSNNLIGSGVAVGSLVSKITLGTGVTSIRLKSGAGQNADFSLTVENGKYVLRTASVTSTSSYTSKNIVFEYFTGGSTPAGELTKSVDIKAPGYAGQNVFTTSQWVQDPSSTVIPVVGSAKPTNFRVIGDVSDSPAIAYSNGLGQVVVRSSNGVEWTITGAHPSFGQSISGVRRTADQRIVVGEPGVNNNAGRVYMFSMADLPPAGGPVNMSSFAAKQMIDGEPGSETGFSVDCRIFGDGPNYYTLIGKPGISKVLAFQFPSSGTWSSANISTIDGDLVQLLIGPPGSRYGEKVLIADQSFGARSPQNILIRSETNRRSFYVSAPLLKDFQNVTRGGVVITHGPLDEADKSPWVNAMAGGTDVIAIVTRIHSLDTPPFGAVLLGTDPSRTFEVNLHEAGNINARGATEVVVTAPTQGGNDTMINPSTYLINPNTYPFESYRRRSAFGGGIVHVITDQINLYNSGVIQSGSFYGLAPGAMSYNPRENSRGAENVNGNEYTVGPYWSSIMIGNLTEGRFGQGGAAIGNFNGGPFYSSGIAISTEKSPIFGAPAGAVPGGPAVALAMQCDQTELKYWSTPESAWDPLNSRLPFGNLFSPPDVPGQKVIIYEDETYAIGHVMGAASLPSQPTSTFFMLLQNKSTGQYFFVARRGDRVLAAPQFNRLASLGPAGVFGQGYPGNIVYDAKRRATPGSIVVQVERTDFTGRFDSTVLNCTLPANGGVFEISQNGTLTLAKSLVRQLEQLGPYTFSCTITSDYSGLSSRFTAKVQFTDPNTPPEVTELTVTPAAGSTGNQIPGFLIPYGLFYDATDPSNQLVLNYTLATGDPIPANFGFNVSATPEGLWVSGVPTLDAGDAAALGGGKIQFSVVAVDVDGLASVPYIFGMDVVYSSFAMTSGPDTVALDSASSNRKITLGAGDRLVLLPANVTAPSRPNSQSGVQVRVNNPVAASAVIDVRQIQMTSFTAEPWTNPVTGLAGSKIVTNTGAVIQLDGMTPDYVQSNRSAMFDLFRQIITTVSTTSTSTNQPTRDSSTSAEPPSSSAPPTDGTTTSSDGSFSTSATESKADTTTTTANPPASGPTTTTAGVVPPPPPSSAPPPPPPPAPAPPPPSSASTAAPNATLASSSVSFASSSTASTAGTASTIGTTASTAGTPGSGGSGSQASAAGGSGSNSTVYIVAAAVGVIVIVVICGVIYVYRRRANGPAIGGRLGDRSDGNPNVIFMNRLGPAHPIYEVIPGDGVDQNPLNPGAYGQAPAAAEATYGSASMRGHLAPPPRSTSAALGTVAEYAFGSSDAGPTYSTGDGSGDDQYGFDASEGQDGPQYAIATAAATAGVPSQPTYDAASATGPEIAGSQHPTYDSASSAPASAGPEYDTASPRPAQGAPLPGSDLYNNFSPATGHSVDPDEEPHMESGGPISGSRRLPNTIRARSGVAFLVPVDDHGAVGTGYVQVQAEPDSTDE